MRRLMAIAGLTLRGAVRSRMVLSMLVMLAIAVLLLPYGLRSDGTPQGEVNLLINYSLNFVFALLAIATVWAGCAAISTDIKERYIQMTLVKPIHRHQIWLGKWVGLLIMNALYLTLAGGAVYVLLQHRLNQKIKDGAFSEAQVQLLKNEILVSRRVIHPPEEDFSAAAREKFKAFQKEGRIDASKPVNEQLHNLELMLANQANTVEPGASRSWTIDLPELPGPNQPVTLRYLFSTASYTLEEVKGVWVFQADKISPGIAFTNLHRAGSPQTILIPPEAINRETQQVLVSYANIHEGRVPIIFDIKRGVEVLYVKDTFAMNYLRSLLVVYCQLAFLAALSVTAGTIFSMPVATFVSIVFITLLGFNRTIQSAVENQEISAIKGDGWVASAFNAVVEVVYVGLSKVLAPLQQTSPLELLAAGEMISWNVVASNVVIRMGLYAGVLALLGWSVFRYREVGRAQ